MGAVLGRDDSGGYRDILATEWEQYEWHEVTTWSDLSKKQRVYLRGKKKTEPPQDGYQYMRCDKFADEEYKWERLIHKFDVKSMVCFGKVRLILIPTLNELGMV